MFEAARVFSVAVTRGFWSRFEGSRDEEPARLLELGDPEGNEFCILRSEAEREAAAPEA